jgi:hypothetical protein
MMTNHRRKIGLIVFLLIVSIPTLLYNLLIGGSILTTISLACTIIVCASLALQLRVEKNNGEANPPAGGPTFGKRHAWLYASLLVGLALVPLVYLSLHLGLAIDPTIARIASIAVSSVVVAILFAFAIRATM